MEDEKIITLYQERSETAIRETDQKYHRYCFCISNQILHDSEDSEECVNDTWMKAWNSIPPTIPRVLRSFLGKIARNLALNRYEANTARKRGGGEIPLIYEEMEQCITDTASAEYSVDRLVLTEVLNRFLSAQPKEKRIIFVKRYWYMQPISEIALQLGLSESKIKMTLLRCRKSLAKELKKEGIEI